MDTIEARFTRPEPRRRVRGFVAGLLAPLPVKNCWSIAEHAGDDGPGGMQDLIGRASWDDAAVRADVRGFVADRLGHPDGILVVDETGDQKKGVHTVGVQRQYSGTAGKIENCQLAVHLSYATPLGHTLLDVALYLPKSWTEDPARRAQAGVPDTVAFATKPQLARRLIATAVAGGLPCRWVTGDEAYGGDPQLAAAQRGHRLGYVLAVARSHRIPTGLGVARADQIAAGLPRTAWQRLSAGTGAKGFRYYDWAFIALPLAEDTHGGHHWMLIRRNRTTGELAFYRCWSPEPVALHHLVTVAGRRWSIEESLCATRRLVASPTQLGGTREEVSGSEWLTRSRKVGGDKSMPGNQRPGPDVRGGALGDPRDMAKAEVPEAQSPVDATSHPSEKTFETGVVFCGGDEA